MQLTDEARDGGIYTYTVPCTCLMVSTHTFNAVLDQILCWTPFYPAGNKLTRQLHYIPECWPDQSRLYMDIVTWQTLWLCDTPPTWLLCGFVKLWRRLELTLLVQVACVHQLMPKVPFLTHTFWSRRFACATWRSKHSWTLLTHTLFFFLSLSMHCFSPILGVTRSWFTVYQLILT